MKPFCRGLFLLLVVTLGGAALWARPDAATWHWVGTWLSAQQLTEPHNLPPAPGLAGHTLRQIVQPSLGGASPRVTFSNVFGEAPLVIGAAHLARSAGGSVIVAESDVELTFGGSPTVTVPPGATMTSDPVGLDVTAFTNLAVTAYFSAVPTSVTGHPGSRTTSFILAGEHVAAPLLAESTPVDHWYFLSGIDVRAAERTGAIVVLGDSLTDGRGSTTNGNDRWPNQLSRRLQAAPATAHLAVLNQGLGGNCVVRGGLGPTGLARFERDVLAVPHVRFLVVLEGINDLGGAVAARKRGVTAAAAPALIAAYRQMILRAHDHGVRVYGGTIMPCGGFDAYFTPESEAERQAVNAWIRTSGAFDGVIDFDAIVRDPADPTRLAAAFDGGDHLHLSAAGYRLMAEAIDLSRFEN